MSDLNADPEALHCVIKNTFLEAVDSSKAQRELNRSHSDSDISRSLGSDSESQSSSKVSSKELFFSSRETPVAERSVESNSFSWLSSGDSQASGSYVGAPNLAGHTEEQKGEWSAGSELHALGQCKPCLYMSTKVGCLNGTECRFCHLGHMKKNRARPCKSTRSQCKQMVAMLETSYVSDPQQFQETADKLAKHSTYMRSILKGKTGRADVPALQDATSASNSSVTSDSDSFRSLPRPYPEESASCGYSDKRTHLPARPGPLPKVLSM